MIRGPLEAPKTTGFAKKISLGSLATGRGPSPYLCCVVAVPMDGSIPNLSKDVQVSWLAVKLGALMVIFN